MSQSGADDPYIALIEANQVINGRYNNPQRLGRTGKEGHFSLLFRATDGNTGQEVALKFFDPRHDHDEYRRNAFSREVRLLSELNGQPNILQLIEGEQLFNIDVSAGGIILPFQMKYFVTELASASLKDYIYSQDNDPLTRLILFREACKGVQRVHRRNIVHRDIKPDNCLLFPERVVKVGDFGTARNLNEMTLLPRYDLPVGDTRYTALEIFCGLGNDPQYFFGADFFSLGAILFELFTRQILTQLVYEDETLMDLSEIFLKHVPGGQRRDQLDSVLPKVLNKWGLPDLSAVENLAPRSIRERLDLFYERLANLDYRQRAQITFQWIFREIDICVKILEHEQSYRRWLEFKRRLRQKRNSGSN